MAWLVIIPAVFCIWAVLLTLADERQRRLAILQAQNEAAERAEAEAEAAEKMPSRQAA